MCPYLNAKDESNQNKLMKEIGKEIGLIHEMLITGRKAKVGEPFYTTLTQNEEWFGNIAQLTLQFAAIKKLGTEVTAVDESKSQTLIETVNLVLKSKEGNTSCITCDWSARRRFVHLYVPGEILTKDAERIAKLETKEEQSNADSRRYRYYSDHFFNNLIGKGLREIGIHPEELAICYDGVHVVDNGQRIVPGSCCGPEAFEVGLHKAITRHNVICQMMAL